MGRLELSKLVVVPLKKIRSTLLFFGCCQGERGN
jgi:hypothetical protein